MQQKTISLTGCESRSKNKENLARPIKPASRPAAFVDNVVPRARLTTDIEMEKSEKELNNVAMFKEVILKERSANIKAYHLKMKDQDDMIKQMRTRVVENKSNEKSLVNSRHTSYAESEVGEETSNITKKLSMIEKTLLCSRKRLERHSFRTQYLIPRTQSSADFTRDLVLSPTEQLGIAKLHEKISTRILGVDNNIKKLLEIIHSCQKQHQSLREDCETGQQEIQKATAVLSTLKNEKQVETEQLRLATQRFSHLKSIIQERIEIARRNYLAQNSDCYQHSGSKVSVAQAPRILSSLN